MGCLHVDRGARADARALRCLKAKGPDEARLGCGACTPALRYKKHLPGPCEPTNGDNRETLGEGESRAARFPPPRAGLWLTLTLTLREKVRVRVRVRVRITIRVRVRVRERVRVRVRVRVSGKGKGEGEGEGEGEGKW